MYKNTLKSDDLSRTATDYNHAVRLYHAAVNMSDDSLLLNSLSDIYSSWAKSILASNRPDTAAKYIDLACNIAPGPSCPELLDLYFKKTGSPLDQTRYFASNDATLLKYFAEYNYNVQNWQLAYQYYEKSEEIRHDPTSLTMMHMASEKIGIPFDLNRFYISDNKDDLAIYAQYFYSLNKLEQAEQLYEKSENIEHSMYNLIAIYEISQKTEKKFDINRFLRSENADELWGYGNQLYYKEKWAEAEMLYTKSEQIAHSADILIRLFEISQKTGSKFEFSRFLETDKPNELIKYGDYFRRKKLWSEAYQLYEKSEKIQHNPRAFVLLSVVSEQLGQPIDFNRFTSSNKISELEEYVEVFENINIFDNENFLGDSRSYAKSIYRLQHTLPIREKQMQLDTSTELRISVSNNYNSLGYYLLFQSKGEDAEAALKRAHEINPENKYIPTNVPYALLAQGKEKVAKEYFQEWADKPYGLNGHKDYRAVFLSDLKRFEEAKVTGINFDKVREWLKKEDTKTVTPPVKGDEPPLPDNN
jgi:tetratricopeptide (TPR) repeat protein